MPYVTGTAANMAAIASALVAACTANGWTQDGAILSKGGCYVRLGTAIEDEGTPTPPAGSRLLVQAGNGASSGVLTDAADWGARIGLLQHASTTAFPDWDWPVTYHIHVLTDPDEVYLVVNYGAGEFFQHLAFGKSPGPGNAGTGNWHSASIPRAGYSQRRVNSVGISPDGASLSSFSQRVLGPGHFFWPGAKDTSYVDYLSGAMHGAIHAGTGLPIWSHPTNPYSVGGATDYGRIAAGLTIQPLMSYQPNAWNHEAVLLPCQIAQDRPDSKTSIIGELGHLRFLRCDYLDPGAIIDLTPDLWKVYPMYRKNTAARDGGSNIDHSGTMAMAIRYDGP